MRNYSRVGRAGHVLFLALVFVISVYAVSSLMPLLLRVATMGLDVAEGISIAGYLFTGAISIGILARAMYRLDKRAGRVRNKVRWFE